MPAITVKRVPDDLHRRIKALADEHGRSLNSEIIACLQAALAPQRIDAAELLEQARALRAEIKGRLTDRTLRGLKERGRP
jgi:plasmid stability protein